MRIKSLKVSGFKSFCHSVEMRFQQNGITIVVGPNGCGKSNVVDAIRWVLGEQRPKHLRGGSMEDVIFAGSSFQKPMGMAEVTLTFSNTEGDTIRNFEQYTEIAITRRLFRSGESVYMINRTPVRLKDIRELFMDTGVGGTGYSIVEQGRVGEIVSARPAERRTLIDDAAGIVKFRIKRETAERRMEETLQNLMRVNDVLSELNEREESLRENVERARTFLDLQNQSQLVEKQLLCVNWRQASMAEKHCEKTLQQLKQEQQTIQNEKSVFDARVQQLTLEQTRLAAGLQEHRERMFEKEKEIQESENQRNLEQQHLRNVEEQRERQAEELEELQEKLEQLKNDREQGADLAQKLKNRREEIETGIFRIEQEKAEKEDEFHQASSELQALQKKLLRLHTELTNQTNQGNFINERLDNILERQKRLEEMDQSHKQLYAEVAEKLESVQEQSVILKQQQEVLEERSNDLEKRVDSQTELIEEEETRLVEIQYQQSVVRSRMESLQHIQNNYEDFDDSVKGFMHLMQEDQSTRKNLGILGVIADFIKAEPDILEQGASVMAEVLDWVVVEKGETLRQVEAFCREHDIGSLRFLALDRLPLKADSGDAGMPLNAYLRFEPLFEEWGTRFFSRFQLLEEPDQFWEKAQKAWPPGAVEWISNAGSRMTEMSFQFGQPLSGSLGYLQRQQDILQLQEQAEAIQERCEEMEMELERKQQELENLRTEHQACFRKHRETELEWLSCSKELEHHQHEHKRISQLLQQNAADIEKIHGEIDLHQQRRQSVNQSLESLEQQREELDSQVEMQDERIQLKRQTVDSVGEDLLSQRVALTETMEQQKNIQENESRMHRELLEYQRRIESLRLSLQTEASKREKSEQRIEEIDAAFGDLLEQHESLKNELAVETEEHERKSEELHLNNQQMQEIQRNLELSTEKLHEESLQQTELRMKREQLEGQITEISDLSPEELLNDPVLDQVDERSLARESRTLKARLNAMGHVNLGAPEEHEALMERIGFLSSQSEDLQKAIDDLKKTIRDINAESRRRFRTMFDQVNEKFKFVFTTLFEGGDARMVLTESEDLLDAGVDIVAQPPGKKLQNINLLSGGEKALTAISLIFAIFLIKPSPFCLLDEVDAPLDDANVIRFNKLIRKLTDNAQFIIITHNKKTMEIGNLLYGVTMENPGISKTVSVQFKEAERLIA